MEKLSENLEFSEEDFRRLEGSKLLDKKRFFRHLATDVT